MAEVEVNLTIVTSIDDNFALPATVMMRSVVDQLGGTRSVDFYVLDCGLRSRNRWKIRRSIPKAWARIHFIQMPARLLTGFRVDGHISIATYARLFIDQLLPDSVDRVMYMDGDMLALTDISALWHTNLGSYPLAAVQDPVAGRVGQSAQMVHWQGWDVPDGTSVFNAGLMLIDLPAWRTKKIAQHAITVARQYPERMKYWDQCALNYVIRGDYLELDPTWNVLPFVFYPPHCNDVIYEPELMQRSIHNPKILHYGGTWRPWKGAGRHWREAEFYRYLYRTAWRNEVYCAPWMGRGNTAWTRFRRYVKKTLANASRQKDDSVTDGKQP